jgi:hypothetical protein
MRNTPLNRLLTKTIPVPRWTGSALKIAVIVLILAGLWMGYYYYQLIARQQPGQRPQFLEIHNSDPNHDDTPQSDYPIK